MIEKIDVITLDGPASAGKDTVGSKFASIIGYRFIDTGPMFRIGGLEILNRGLEFDDHQQVAEIFRTLSIDYQRSDGVQRILVNGADWTDKLYTHQLSELASKIG